MAWNLVQQNSGQITSGVVSPESLAFLNPNQSGNLLVLQVLLETNNGTVGAPTGLAVTDTNSNSYLLPKSATNYDFTNGYTSSFAYAFNSVAGANAISLAFNNGISFVTGTSNASASASTFSGSVTPSAVGQLILIWCATLNASAVTMTVSDNQSNVYTQVLASSSASGSVYVWWAYAVNTSATTYTVTTKVGGVTTAVSAASFASIYAGINGTNPVDVHQGAPVAATGTSAGPSGGNILPSFYGEWCVTGMLPASGTITDPTGFTNRETSATVVAHSDDSNAVQGIGSAINPTWTLSGSAAWIAFNLLLVPAGPPVTDIFWFLSEYENSGGAVTVDPFDGAGWSTAGHGNAAVPPQILVPVTAPNDLVLMHAFVNNSTGVAGQIGGVNATVLGTLISGVILSQYLTTGAPFQTPGFAPGIVPCTLGQPETQWTGAAIAFRFGGNPNTSKLPALANNVSTPIFVATTLNLLMPAPCTAGDTIVLSLNSTFSISSITDTAGNTYHLASSSLPNAIYYAYNINAYAAGNVISITYSGSSSSYADALEYTGVVSTSNPLDQTGFTAATTGTSGTTPTVTTLFPNEVVVAMWTTGNPFFPQLGGGATTWNYLFNTRDGGSNNEQTEVDLVLGAPGAIVSTGTLSGSGGVGSGIATFKSKALFISVQPTNRTAVVGGTATFSITALASDGGSLTYQWQLNGSNIGGATSSSYTTPTLGVGTGGTYTCQVTDTYGTTVSQPALLLVTANPGGGIGIPTLGQVANGELPPSGTAPTIDVIWFGTNA